MLGQADIVDKMEVGLKDLVGSMTRQHIDKHRYNAFHYDGVGIGAIHYLAVGIQLCIEPHAALAAFDEPVGSLKILWQCRETVAHVDYTGIAVHPVVDGYPVQDR